MAYTFEQALQQQILTKDVEKTSIDKLLARKEVERVRELVRMEKLGRENTLELLYMCLSAESKLINLDSHTRYILLKFFVWIREFTKLIEIMYDLRSDLEKDKNINLSERTKKFLDTNERYMEHNAKFLVDLYLNIGRTSLSLGATGFLELLKNKFEMQYLQNGGMPTQVSPGDKKRWFWGGHSGGKEN